MKYLKYFFIYAVPILLLGGIVFAIFSSYLRTSIATPRQAEQFTIDPDAKDRQAMNVPAAKLPTFSVDITAQKFKNFVDASKQQIKTLAQATIVHEAYASEKLETEVTLDESKSKLIVHPKDAPNFKPGMYKLHLKLRTLEGYVNVEQDFSWGVIAVNSNKSIYKPGDVAKIGIGVLNDAGETQCMTGQDAAEVWLTITDPHGKAKDYSTESGNIKDSGECGPITVTNTADALAIYLIDNKPGLYKMKVTARIKGGEKRSIEDYFKVEASPAFDVERSSFPTRIYPRAAYNVRLSVTADLNDYSGRIEDIVPASFKISNITGGREELHGDFKKIIWDTTLKKGQKMTLMYTIHFPQVSPEFYLLGPLKIGDFQEARQWQIASDAINSTTGVVSYENNGGSNTFYRIWTGTAWSPAPPTAGSDMDVVGDTPDDSRWFVEKTSPKTAEKLVAAYDNSSAPVAGTERIWIYRWNGTTWIEDFFLDINTNDVETRPVDIAYEEESGNALLVYSDTTNQLKYRTKPNLGEGASWTATGSAGTGLDSRKRWVKAKPQFNSDNILVGFLNTSLRIGALIWNGSSDTFINQFVDDDTVAQTETSTSDEEPFDIAWETQSGTPMIFWGTAAQQLMSREFTGGAWSGETARYTTDADAANDIEWVSAASDPDPTSNYIALAMQETVDNDGVDDATDCEFGMWTGSGVETLAGLVSCRSDNDGRLNTVQFENTGGRAVFVYAPSESGTNGNSVSYRTWQTGSGSPGSSTAITGDATGNIESVQLHTDLNSKSMIALTGDSAGDLNHVEWEGDASTWTAVFTTDVYDNIQNAGENAEAYGYGFDRNLEEQVAYRWFVNSGTTTISSALTTQDTPYTLTTANEEFRLRLLLYYPDSLAISGRNYILQYVDPGTGTCANPTGGTPSTWTDVAAPGSPGSTEISYFNNATPADGDNLVGNASLDPTYLSFDPSDAAYVEQDYEEGNGGNALLFTNSVSAMSNDRVALWDFSLIDNTDFDRIAQTYCFRVARASGTNRLPLRIQIYPQINTAAESDVLIRGGSLIQGGTLLQ
jgi:hypothetical protein